MKEAGVRSNESPKKSEFILQKLPKKRSILPMRRIYIILGWLKPALAKEISLKIFYAPVPLIGVGGNL